jgi:phosphoribosylformimino-5-aminoimidazole carboxamide ribotide isomerase
MRVVGVIDLMGGVVVRGVGGRRAEYRPVESALCASANPTDVAEGFRREYGITELYLADLDAIAGSAPAWRTYEALTSAGFRLWVDAGVRTIEDGRALVRAGVGVVVGLETAEGPHVVEALAREEILFSLDLRGGEPLGMWGVDVWAITAEAIHRGAKRVLVLDLARVGETAGVGTEALCARLAASYPGVETWAGGGVRDADDLARLRAAGVRVALISTALHRRTISRTDLTRADIFATDPQTS